MPSRIATVALILWCVAAAMADDEALQPAGAIVVNGQTLADAHLMQKGRVPYFPLVALAAALGHEARYDAASKILLWDGKAVPGEVVDVGGVPYVPYKTVAALMPGSVRFGMAADRAVFDSRAPSRVRSVPAADTSSTPYTSTTQTGVRVESAEFGIIVDDRTTGEVYFKPTGIVPRHDDQAFGWRVKLDGSYDSVHWRDEFVVPRPPATWGKSPYMTVAPDRCSAVTERDSKPVDGYIYNVWFVAPGDPTGEQSVTVYVDGTLVKTFKFRIQ